MSDTKPIIVEEVADVSLDGDMMIVIEYAKCPKCGSDAKTGIDHSGEPWFHVYTCFTCDYVHRESFGTEELPDE